MKEQPSEKMKHFMLMPLSLTKSPHRYKWRREERRGRVESSSLLVHTCAPLNAPFGSGHSKLKSLYYDI
jgi:hypothetical protein